MQSTSKKIWKRVLRIAAIVLGVYLILMIALSIYITSSKERLVSFLTAKMKESIVGELKINKGDVTVWQTFPKIGIRLNNLSISDSFYHNRPFLTAKQITAKIGLFDLFGSKVVINSVEIDDAVLHAFTDKNGYTNSYVLKPQNKEKRKSKKPVVISNLELKNVNIILENAIKQKRFEIKFTDANIDMSFSGSKYFINLDEDMFIRGLGFNLPKGYWLENQRIQGKFKMQFDTAGSILSFDRTDIKIQGQPFTVNGAFFIKEPASHFRIDASTKNISYKAAMAMLKPTTSEKIKKINFSNGLDATITIDGSLAYKTIPLVKVDFSTVNSNMVTPVVTLNSCSFTGSYINQVNIQLPLTDDNSRVTLSGFTSKWGDIILKGKDIVVTNLIKPVIQFEFYSQCTLPQLDEQLSSSVIEMSEGTAKLYLSYNGPLIADASLLNQLNAKIQVINGKVIYIPRNLIFSQCNGNIDIEGNNLAMNNFTCNLNTNHFVVNLTGDNLNRISSKINGKANINCNIFSPAINLNDFKSLFEQKSKSVTKKQNGSLGETANSIDDAVENGNLYVNIKANKLMLHHFVANNAVANILFQENDWGVQKAALQFGDGSFDLTAKVHQVNDVTHQLDAQMNLQHIDVKKLLYAFDNFSQTGITSNNLTGVVDSKADINATITGAGKLAPSSLNGQIFFSLKNGSIINLQALKGLQKYVFKNRDLDNVQFAEIKDTFDIRNGDVFIHRMPIQSSVLNMYIEGVYSFADRTDISIQVPFNTLLKKPNDDYKNINKEKTDKPGASIYLRAKSKDGKIKVGLDIFRRMRDKKYDKMANDSL